MVDAYIRIVQYRNMLADTIPADELRGFLRCGRTVTTLIFFFRYVNKKEGRNERDKVEIVEWKYTWLSYRDRERGRKRETARVQNVK